MFALRITTDRRSVQIHPRRIPPAPLSERDRQRFWCVKCGDRGADFTVGWTIPPVNQPLSRSTTLGFKGSLQPAKLRRAGVTILNNDVYAGRVIWNRSKWVKDPDTGRR